MVPLGDDLQGGSNQGGKALSDIQVPSLRFRQLATQGSNHLVKEGACGSVEPIVVEQFARPCSQVRPGVTSDLSHRLFRLRR